MKYSCNKFRQMYKAITIRDWILLVGMKDRGSTCKFRNERRAFRNLHVNQLSFIILWERNKWDWILIFILYQNCSVFLAMKYQFLIHNRVVFRTAAVTAVWYVKGTVSQKNEFQIISYVHSSRKHWKCKYINIYFMVWLVCWTVKTVPTIKFHLSLTLKGKQKKQLYTISQVYSEISVYSTKKHPYTEIFTHVL